MGRFKFHRGLGVSMDALRKLFDLSGRVALITGGSRGLGLQIAEALGEFGATLVLTARKQDELDAAVGHLSGHGIAAWQDVTDSGGCCRCWSSWAWCFW